MSRTLFALACLLGLAVAGGCSAEELSDRLDKAEYVAELERVVNQVKADGQELEKLIEAQSPDALDKAIDEADADLADLAGRLEDIEPPEEVADLHDRLTEVVAQFSDLFGEAREALGAGDLTGLLALAPAAEELRFDFGEIRSEFAAKGYEVRNELGAAGP